MCRWTTAWSSVCSFLPFFELDDRSILLLNHPFELFNQLFAISRPNFVTVHQDKLMFVREPWIALFVSRDSCSNEDLPRFQKWIRWYVSTIRSCHETMRRLIVRSPSLVASFTHETVRPSVIAHVFFSGCRGDHYPLPCISLWSAQLCYAVRTEKKTARRKIAVTRDLLRRKILFHVRRIFSLRWGIRGLGENAHCSLTYVNRRPTDRL